MEITEEKGTWVDQRHSAFPYTFGRRDCASFWRHRIDMTNILATRLEPLTNQRDTFPQIDYPKPRHL